MKEVSINRKQFGGKSRIIEYLSTRNTKIERGLYRLF